MFRKTHGIWTRRVWIKLGEMNCEGNQAIYANFIKVGSQQSFLNTVSAESINPFFIDFNSFLYSFTYRRL
jgi:hypothetical protein